MFWQPKKFFYFKIQAKSGGKNNPRRRGKRPLCWADRQAFNAYDLKLLVLTSYLKPYLVEVVVVLVEVPVVVLINVDKVVV